MFFLGAILAYSSCIEAGSIVYPYNAAKEFIKSGEAGMIYYQKSAGEQIDPITLVGPYNRVKVSILKDSSGAFEYDPLTHATYSSRITITVPSDAPMELYDLAIAGSDGTIISAKAVKVVKLYKNRYTFAHITDTHISYSWINGYPEELLCDEHVIKALNIIGPEFVICTGDDTHNYDKQQQTPDPDAEARWNFFFIGLS